MLHPGKGGGAGSADQIHLFSVTASRRLGHDPARSLRRACSAVARALCIGRRQPLESVNVSNLDTSPVASITARFVLTLVGLAFTSLAISRLMPSSKRADAPFIRLP